MMTRTEILKVELMDRTVGRTARHAAALAVERRYEAQEDRRCLGCEDRHLGVFHG